MAELADAHGSGPCAGNSMQVQVLFPAPELDTGFGTMRIEAGVRFLFAKVPIYKGTERVRSTLAGLAFLRLLSVEFTEKIPRALHIKSAFPDDF